MRPLLLVLALAAAATGAHAQDRECRNGAFPREQDAFGLAQVRGSDRLPLLTDSDGCPDPSPRCRGRAYLVAGDRVLTGRSLGPYVCAYFPNRSGGSAGWVERARLTPTPVATAPPPSAWTGVWRDGDDTLKLRARPGGVLQADGDAYWPSANPPLSVRPGGPNIGELQGGARPAGARLHVADDACTVDLQLVGPYLVARDNMACGGMNVSFTGVYRR